MNKEHALKSLAVIESRLKLMYGNISLYNPINSPKVHSILERQMADLKILRHQVKKLPDTVLPYSQYIFEGSTLLNGKHKKDICRVLDEISDGYQSLKIGSKKARENYKPQIMYYTGNGENITHLPRLSEPLDPGTVTTFGLVMSDVVTEESLATFSGRLDIQEVAVQTIETYFRDWPRINKEKNEDYIIERITDEGLYDCEFCRLTADCPSEEMFLAYLGSYGEESRICARCITDRGDSYKFHAKALYEGVKKWRKKYPPKYGTCNRCDVPLIKDEEGQYYCQWYTDHTFEGPQS